MSHIQFDYSKALKFFAQHELDYIQYQVTAADKALREGTGPGNDFTGWIDLPKDYDKEEFARIKAAAKNPIRFRSFGCYRYRWFLFRRPCCN